MMINVNGEYMGNATTDIDGCFGFPSFNAELLAYERERERERVYDKRGQVVGGSGCFRILCRRRAINDVYTAFPPVAPPEYEASI